VSVENERAADSQSSVVVLPHASHSPALARHHVVDLIAAETIESSGLDLVIIVSELVSNAVLHTDTDAPIGLTVRWNDQQVRVEVTDGDPDTDQVSPRTIDLPEPGGRGLRIVAALAQRWGVTRTSTGKTVWATL
jgi:anti-sigma regulatory factor (Ser/Thr protein kinase)